MIFSLNSKSKIIFIIIVIIIIIIFYYIQLNNTKEISISNEEDYNILEKNNKNTNETQNQEKIVIYITGAVKKQGVYELDKNSRISDAIDIAEGLTDDANIKNINLAYLLEDGSKIYIPTNQEMEIDNNIDTEDYNAQDVVSTENNELFKEKNKIENKNEKININNANQNELEKLVRNRRINSSKNY